MKGVLVDHKWCSNAIRGPRRSCLFTRPCPFKHTPTRHAPQSSMRMLRRILNGEVGYRKTYSLTMRQEKSLTRQGTICVYIYIYVHTKLINSTCISMCIYLYTSYNMYISSHQFEQFKECKISMKSQLPFQSACDHVWPKIRPQAIMECLSKETSWHWGNFHVASAFLSIWDYLIFGNQVEINKYLWHVDEYSSMRNGRRSTKIPTISQRLPLH